MNLFPLKKIMNLLKSAHYSRHLLKCLSRFYNFSSSHLSFSTNLAEFSKSKGTQNRRCLNFNSQTISSDIYSCNTKITALDRGQRVFDEMCERDVVTHAAMINVYLSRGAGAPVFFSVRREGEREGEREMDARLYKAASSGDVSLLTQLLQEDSKILDRARQNCKDKNNPLHIAARLGHFYFVRKILTHQPQFAGELNSQGQAPLHLASANGHLLVVKDLLEAHPDACYLHDKDGTTPVHKAAMKGRAKVLEELVRADKETAWLLTDQGVPVLHLCVNHNQFETLKMLVKVVNNVEFVNLKDEDDNTVLHLLAAKNQYEVIDFLRTNIEGIDLNVKNVDGLTALDISKENRSGSNHWKTRTILKNFKFIKARRIPSAWRKKRLKKKQNEKYQKWASTIKESLMVVATLMASIAFQAALNPPGGVWQENGHHNSSTSHDDPNYPPEQIPHIAGEAVISYNFPGYYKAFTLLTALGLLASLSLILFLVSGFSFQREISMWILMFITWIAVASIMGTYLVSYFSLTPHEVFDSKEFWMAVPGVILVWSTLVFMVFSIHIYHFIFPFLYPLSMATLKFLRISSCYIPREYSADFRTIMIEESRGEANP